MHFPHTQRLSAKKVAQNFVGQKNSITFASHLKKRHDSVAQLVEQMTLNHWVESSSLSGVTKRGNSNRDFLFFVICCGLRHQEFIKNLFALRKPFCSASATSQA